MAVQNVTIAVSYVQLSVIVLGLSSMWIGHFKEKEVASVLNTRLRLIIPMGYANEKIQLKKNQKS